MMVQRLGRVSDMLGEEKRERGLLEAGWWMVGVGLRLACEQGLGILYGRVGKERGVKAGHFQVMLCHHH